MRMKKWLVAAVAAVSLTAVAGTSAFAIQNGGSGGDGGSGGNSGQINDIDVDAGDADVRGDRACQDTDANGESAATASCRGFNARGGNARLTLRTGNGGRGGAGGGGGRGGDRFVRRSFVGGGFPF